MKIELTVLVVAGSKEEFDQFVNSLKRLSDKVDFIYLDTLNKARGRKLSDEVELVTTGTWEQKEHCRAILEYFEV